MRKQTTFSYGRINVSREKTYIRKGMELIKNKAESAAGKRHNRRKGTKRLSKPHIGYQ